MQVAFCNISLVDDGEHEPNENFKVLLKEAQGSLWYGAKVGGNDEVLVTITNTEDGKSISIGFENIMKQYPRIIIANTFQQGFKQSILNRYFKRCY